MKSLREGYLGAAEATAVLTFFLATKVFLTFPQSMVQAGKTSAWMLPIISGLLTLPGIWALVRVVERYPGRSIVEVTQEVLGPLVGSLANLSIFLTFLLITATILRQFTESIVTLVLPETPVSVISLFFTVAIVYAAYSGMEAISRTAWIVFPWILAGLLLILGLVLPWANYHRLFPLLGVTPLQLIALAGQKMGTYSEFLILGLIYPAIRPPARGFRLAAVALAATVGVISATMAVIVAVHSVSDAQRQVFPLFQLSRLIYLGRFVQRVDSVFILVWVFSGLLKLSVGLYGAADSLARWLRLPLYQPLVFPLAVIVFSLSFLPKDIETAVALDQRILRAWGWVPAFGIPLLTWAVLALKERGVPRRGR